MSECMTQEDAERMDASQAVQILKPLRAIMLDQFGCPISDVYFALGKAIEALEQQTVDAVPVEWIESYVRDASATGDFSDEMSAVAIEAMLNDFCADGKPKVACNDEESEK